MVICGIHNFPENLKHLLTQQVQTVRFFLSANSQRFFLVMDEVTSDIQGEISWCMLFADDVVLVDESRAGVNRKVSGVAITYPDKRRRILLHILNEGNILSWDFVLL